ncbi:MAG: HAMP domain-containing histidine kinase [Deltaproteobacteria bacterium]|nr:HAMP domain-containing histidine kinase [Deltaproteobacteria bacterium]
MENRALRDSTFQLSLLAGKAGFALGSIHDVNNMLQAAQIGLAYLLRKDPDNRAVQNIAEAVDRGIQNFTNMKGILNGNKEIRSISLTKAIEVSQRLAEKNLRDRDITVSTDFEEASFVLHGNEGMLVQAIYNMMINASHAMPQGGQLTLRLRRQSTNIVFEMEDTGTGIAPEHLSHIFDLNFTTKGNQGNGIGLYMVKQIIENIHQGTIEVQSTPGSGTTFRITLPQQRRPSILPQNRQ